jgi:uncharacterized RDD family membrane protein YckC
MQDLRPDASVAVPYAGFWARLFATLLDTLIQFVVLTPLLIYFFGLEALMDPDADTGYGNWVINVSLLVVVVLFWKYRSATPGKMMMGLKVVDAATLGSVPVGRLVLRYLAYYVSLLPLCLGFVWVAFDKRKRGFHDMIAKTVVVHAEQTRP